jgi:hypothetical protein
MRIEWAVALVALLWVAPACKKKKPAPQPVAQTAAKEAARIPTVVHLGDPRAAGQVLSGFYDIEDGAWRWTAKQFVVELGTPLGSAGRGATLELQFAIPQVVIAKNPSITLSATVDGNLLPPETYTKAGEQVYKRDVPASLLSAESVKVAFEVDKTMTPGGADTRVLGVVATSAGLVRK